MPATDRHKKEALIWITSEAKRLQKKDGNRKPWKKYFSQADAIYAKKHGGRSPVGKPKKQRTVKKRKSAKKRKPVKSVKGVTTKSKSHTDKNKFRNVDITIGAINDHIKIAKSALEQQLSKEMLKLYQAQKSGKTKTERKAIQKRINDIKRRVNKLS